MTRKQGRPAQSAIRQQLLNILATIGPATGYQLHKHYLQRVGALSLRLVYYHLHKACQLSTARIVRIASEQSNNSWGHITEKTYYEALHSTETPPQK